ncbi:MAG: hypothetical protein FJW39_07935 [Acidobacteria bacterium]|nr:hypothetical protein [Acidobacteriota bacterium]
MQLLPLVLAFAIHDGQLTRDAAGNVVEADFTGTWITDADLAKVGRMPKLRRLVLSQAKITDAAMEHLRGLTEVRELDCHYAEYLTEDGVAHITGWKKIERLNLRGTQVTSKVFEHLARMTSLRDVDIAFTQVDDEGFEQLVQLPHLERLAMGGNRLTGSAVQVLRPIRTLVHLDVGGIQRVDSGLWGLPLTPENLRRLGQLTQLRSLNLNGATLSDRGTDRPGNPEAERAEIRDLSALASLRQLEFLDLSRLPVTEAVIAPLRQLPKLREIRTRMTAVQSAR